MIALALLATAGATPQYAWPTTPGAYVSGYYDNDSGGYSTLDWLCGTHTYDGHRGTDIAGMARNTPIYAGAAGTVIRRYDGFGDGYWGDYSGGGFGNHIALYHDDGNTTIYGHMNAYSGIPSLYSTVDCLDAVGGVGTSGNSTGLHLHFEARLGTDGVNYYSGWADDPYAGACSGSVSYWTEQNGSSPLQICGDGTAPEPDFCDGKQDGDWCDGDDLVYCQYGDVSTRSTCADGCLSMPLGTPDECANGTVDACDGLMDGDWCDGSDLITCGGGSELSRSNCPTGCESMPLGTPDQCASGPVDFCDGLMNGDWCDGSDLVECLNGSSVNRDTCEWGCLSMPLGTPDQCDTSATFCGDKVDGLWCDGDDLVYCDDLAETSRETCDAGCESMPFGTADQCASDDACEGLMNGDWCDGSDLITCSNDAVVSRSTCTNGCVSMPLGTPDECAP